MVKTDEGIKGTQLYWEGIAVLSVPFHFNLQLGPIFKLEATTKDTETKKSIIKQMEKKNFLYPSFKISIIR